MLLFDLHVVNVAVVIDEGDLAQRDEIKVVGLDGLAPDVRAFVPHDRVLMW